MYRITYFQLIFVSNGRNFALYFQNKYLSSKAGDLKKVGKESGRKYGKMI